MVFIDFRCFSVIVQVRRVKIDSRPMLRYIRLMLRYIRPMLSYIRPMLSYVEAHKGYVEVHKGQVEAHRTLANHRNPRTSLHVSVQRLSKHQYMD